jgi:hypothetical protein
MQSSPPVKPLLPSAAATLAIAAGDGHAQSMAASCDAAHDSPTTQDAA